jgi:hypothetical protein
VKTVVIESARPLALTAALIFPIPSSRAAIIPATIRRCRPTEHVSPGLSIPGPQPLVLSGVSGMVVLNLSW